MIADTKANKAAREWSNFMWCFTLASLKPKEFTNLCNFILDKRAANEDSDALPYKA